MTTERDYEQVDSQIGLSVCTALRAKATELIRTSPVNRTIRRNQDKIVPFKVLVLNSQADLSSGGLSNPLTSRSYTPTELLQHALNNLSQLPQSQSKPSTPDIDWYF